MTLLKRMLSKLSRRHSSEFSDELESNIHFMQDPLGDPLHLQRAEQALEFLLDHADEAYPRLLELIKSNRASNPIALIEAFSRFGRPESIPVLEEIVARGQGTAIGAASLSLARHPQDSARQALIRALTFPKAESVVAAADGLMSAGRSNRLCRTDEAPQPSRLNSPIPCHSGRLASGVLELGSSNTNIKR